MSFHRLSEGVESKSLSTQYKSCRHRCREHRGRGIIELGLVVAMWNRDISRKSPITIYCRADAAAADFQHDCWADADTTTTNASIHRRLQLSVRHFCVPWGLLTMSRMWRLGLVRQQHSWPGGSSFYDAIQPSPQCCLWRKFPVSGSTPASRP